MRIGLRHPGETGARVGAAATASGARVPRASRGRRRATRERAESEGFREVGSLAALLAASDVALLMCPPGAAPDPAGEVAARGFAGLCADAGAAPALDDPPPEGRAGR